ncbi:hypothetical protein SRHO_G00048900 [Serrasalmus rhombeus]
MVLSLNRSEFNRFSAEAPRSSIAQSALNAESALTKNNHPTTRFMVLFFNCNAHIRILLLLRYSQCAPRAVPREPDVSELDGEFWQQ